MGIYKAHKSEKYIGVNPAHEIHKEKSGKLSSHNDKKPQPKKADKE